jgi:hypothetical protein
MVPIIAIALSISSTPRRLAELIPASGVSAALHSDARLDSFVCFGLRFMALRWGWRQPPATRATGRACTKREKR